MLDELSDNQFEQYQLDLTKAIDAKLKEIDEHPENHTYLDYLLARDTDSLEPLGETHWRRTYAWSLITNDKRR